MKAWTLAALGGAVVMTLGVLASAGLAQPQAAGGGGQALFSTKCATCHDMGLDRAPETAALRRLTAANILTALNGVMAPQAYGLSDADKQAIATFLTTPAAAAGGRGGGRGGAPAVQTVDTPCTSNPAITPGKSDWIGAGGVATGHRYQANPGIRPADVPKLKVKWAFSLVQGNSQPTVIGDWMWISGSGRIYALDPKTGCVRWRAEGIAARNTPAPVRSTVSPSGWMLVIGERSRVIKALDAASGRQLWASAVIEEHRSAGITGSPIIAGDKVFVPTTSGEESAGAAENYACCNFRGSLVALSLTDGKILWKTPVITEPLRPIRTNRAGVTLQGPAGAAIWSQPTVDLKRGLVYVATGDSYTEAPTKGADAIVAIEMATGHIRWSTQVTENDNYIVNCNRGRTTDNCPKPLGPDYDFGASPILFDIGGGKSVVLSGQKSGMTYGMDADTGRLLWSQRVGGGGALGGVEWGMSADGTRLYATNSDILRLQDDILRPLGQNVFAEQPSQEAKPGITALNPKTGRILWHVDAPKDPCRPLTSSRVPRGACINAQSAAPAVMPGIVFSGTSDGWFRAYDADTGRIVWKFSTTAQTYATTNGVPAQPGGGVDGNGPTIAAGMVFVTSGFDGSATYGSTGTGMNVLLAFSVDGK